jgi:putative transposase
METTEYYPEFFTATILNWKHLLKPDKYKDIIVESLRYLVVEKRIKVFAFVIMSNHIHFIWQSINGHKPKENQLSFMKYTAQIILKDLRNNHQAVMEHFRVDLKDRKYQIWPRNPLSVELRQGEVFNHKLEYIHSNPVRAGLCQVAEDYVYSSASYYEKQDIKWEFIFHHSGE